MTPSIPARPAPGFSTGRISLILAFGCALAFFGCVQQPYTECPETGRVCGPGYVCAPGGRACVAANSCGNGIVDPDELCDDGNRLSGDGCSSDCLSLEICGNGVRDIYEACDDGNRDDNDGCSAACVIETCGNGVVEAPYEACDDGAHDNNDGCSADCASDETCGNAYIDWWLGERCDDGNTADDDACPGDCRAGLCGDGLLQAGEACDDGNLAGGDGCGTDCLPESVCGNGVLEPGEPCDAGGVESSLCDLDCTYARCGDGVINQAAGEECDAGGIPSPLCRADCTSVCDPGSCDQGIAAGGRHTCALHLGEVHCWGDAGSGQLGRGDAVAIGDDELPSSVGPVDVGGPVVEIAAGESHTCALLNDGTVRCWGGGGLGQLGTGSAANVGDDEVPSSVAPVNVGGPVEQISVGGNHSCALLTTGEVRCWGRNNEGQLGQGNTIDIGANQTPDAVPPVDVGGPVLQVAAGDEHTCALLTTGNVRCWGRNDRGQLGQGNTVRIGDIEVPSSVPPVDVGGPVLQVSAGAGHTCALLASGAVRCWGNNVAGELGLGHGNPIGDDEPPRSSATVELGGPAVRVVAGWEATCALLATGEVRCWGRNDAGELGVPGAGRIGDDEVPTSAAPVELGAPVLDLSMWSAPGAPGNHACAVLDGDAVRCWGAGSSGQLGYGNTDDIGDDEPPAGAGDVPYLP